MGKPGVQVSVPLLFFTLSLSLSLFSAIHIPPPQFSETDLVNIPGLEDTGSDAHSPEVPTSEWDISDYPGNPDTPNGANIPDYYSNGINSPSVEVQQDKVPAPLETPPLAG